MNRMISVNFFEGYGFVTRRKQSIRFSIDPDITCP